MMGDYHVWLCERLAGETPACLLGEGGDFHHPDSYRDLCGIPMFD